MKKRHTIADVAAAAEIRAMISGERVTYLHGDGRWVEGEVTGVSTDVISVRRDSDGRHNGRLKHHRVVPLHDSAQTRDYVKYALSLWVQKLHDDARHARFRERDRLPADPRHDHARAEFREWKRMVLSVFGRMPSKK